MKEPRKKREKNIEEEDYIPADISRKILNAAHEQQVCNERRGDPWKSRPRS